MLIKNSEDKRDQLQFVAVSTLVPENHLLREIDKAVDFSFIYKLVEDKYSADTGRPSIDPVTLIKIPLIQYLYGITSMRQTIKEIEVNVAYRWFLGLDFTSNVPHFSTFGKNYSRRFKDTDLFEQIFKEILQQCMFRGFVDTSAIFVDATHVKAHANIKKYSKQIAQTQAAYYSAQLKEEINLDRKEHNKKPLKDKDKDDDDISAAPKGEKQQVVSKTDPESGMFHKGEHKKVFAYTVQTGCDINGWILNYSVHPGNEHDSKTFPKIYEKLKPLNPKLMIMDSGYRTPSIARQLLLDGLTPIFPYKRPMTKVGYFKKYEFVYDEYYENIICPNDQILRYQTTDRNGYQKYVSNPSICKNCEDLGKCTNSSNHTKVYVRHIWERYLEKCEDIRHTLSLRGWYERRKETIERIFGTAKEYHGMRYTRSAGKAHMEMKVGLTYACINLKKLVKMIRRNELKSTHFFVLTA